jgi:hypothetical protein
MEILKLTYMSTEGLIIDTHNPSAEDVSSNISLVADANAGEAGELVITINFDEAMSDTDPVVSISDGSFTFDGGTWSDENTYEAEFTVVDAEEEIENIDVVVEEAMDAAGKTFPVHLLQNPFWISILKILL